MTPETGVPMLKPVTFVGISPGNAKYGRKDSSIRRLETWADRMGITHYGFVNCIPYHFGPGYKKSMIDYDHLAKSVGDDIAVALGGFASDALFKLGIRHFKLPHPSGLNRQLNDKVALALILDFCRFYIWAASEDDANREMRP